MQLKPDKTFISEMSENEFLSFLYSERERENEISKFHGWNNWALIGAGIAVLYATYTILGGVCELEWIRVVCYSTGSFALFWSYRSWAFFFQRSRGHNLTRVRLLKEVFPWIDVCLAIIVAIVAIVSISVLGSSSGLIWLWISVIVLQIVAVVVSVFDRDRVVSTFFTKLYFPRIRLNLAYEIVLATLLVVIWRQSFMLGSWSIICPEFELGVCFTVIIILIYLLLVSNFENKAVKDFDEIMDKYIYAGESKENTYKSIIINRVGYGVLEVCNKDLQRIEEMSVACEQKGRHLAEIKDKIQNGRFEMSQLLEFLIETKDTVTYLRDSLHQSMRLSNRLDEIMSLAPFSLQVEDFKDILDANKAFFERILSVDKEVDTVTALLQEEDRKYICQKYSIYCTSTECDQKNDELDKRYIRRMRRRRFFQKLHLLKVGPGNTYSVYNTSKEGHSCGQPSGAKAPAEMSVQHRSETD